VTNVRSDKPDVILLKQISRATANKGGYLLRYRGINPPLWKTFEGKYVKYVILI